MSFRRLTQGRAFISSLFGFTFFATVITVSASNILPCPARPNKGRFMDTYEDQQPLDVPVVIVDGKKKRWIQEKHPAPRTCRGDTKY
ncbi:hypothetical protein C8J56DRAFT_557672 [Mycena floridula]|nr:hypothetical protein C8J56DRAFT_557672 [Mycena floridula]